MLLYAAEDALHVVRRRLEGICAAAAVALPDLDVQVITAPTVRLDLEADRASLDETVTKLKPRLLVLDPFVRLHRIDENASGEVAPAHEYPMSLDVRAAHLWHGSQQRPSLGELASEEIARGSPVLSPPAVDAVCLLACWAGEPCLHGLARSSRTNSQR